MFAWDQDLFFLLYQSILLLCMSLSEGNQSKTSHLLKQTMNGKKTKTYPEAAGSLIIWLVNSKISSNFKLIWHAAWWVCNVDTAFGSALIDWKEVLEINVHKQRYTWEGHVCICMQISKWFLSHWILRGEFNTGKVKEFDPLIWRNQEILEFYK